MKPETTKHRIAASLIAIALSTLACTSEPVSYSGLDDGEHTTNGTWATGSRYMQPEDFVDRPELAREAYDLDEKRWPPLPQDKIDSLTRFMTRDEVLEIMGSPDFDDVQVTDIDSGERDWNAWVHTWKFNDDRTTPMILTRDFEARFAWLGKDKMLPQRPEITGPAWILLQWELR